MTTIFSAMTCRVEGPLRTLAGRTSVDQLSAEWFAWLLAQLANEAGSVPDGPGTLRRHCYLIVERSEGPGYVQFAAGADGTFIAEASSNQSLGVDAVSPVDEYLLETLGWEPPATGPRGPRPNFRTDNERSSLGRIALIALRALTDVFAVSSIDELRYTYFDAIRFVDGDERGERVPPPTLEND